MTRNLLVRCRIRGADAAEFLQGYLTADSTELRSNLAIPMAIPDLKGRVLANGWTYGEPNDVYLVVHDSVVEAVKQHLRKYLLFAKSDFDDTISTCDLQPGTEGVQLRSFEWAVTISPKPSREWVNFVIQHDCPIVTEPTSGKFLPQMLRLTEVGAVSFEKGCYLGQEVVARAEHRGRVKRKLLRFRWEGPSLTLGDKVREEGTSNGVVVNCDPETALVVASGDPTVMYGEETKLIRL